MIIHAMKQRSPEWDKIHLGKITSTSFTPLANGKHDTVRELCMKTALERIYRVTAKNSFSNKAMLHGINTEPAARGMYEWESNVIVQEVGFIEYSDYFGCSPDGLIDDDGGLEIKCPIEDTHKKYLEKDDAWKAYKWQIQSSLYMSERKWWDFVSYCPPLPMIIQRVTPDDECFDKIKDGMELCQKWIRNIVLAWANEEGRRK